MSLLRVADEYGEVDAEIRVGRDGIVVELDGVSVDFEAADAWRRRHHADARQEPGAHSSPGATARQ